MQIYYHFETPYGPLHNLLTDSGPVRANWIKIQRRKCICSFPLKLIQYLMSDHINWVLTAFFLLALLFLSLVHKNRKEVGSLTPPPLHTHTYACTNTHTVGHDNALLAMHEFQLSISFNFSYTCGTVCVIAWFPLLSCCIAAKLALVPSETVNEKLSVTVSVPSCW